MTLGLEEELLAVGERYKIQIISTEETGGMRMKEYVGPPNIGAGKKSEAT